MLNLPDKKDLADLPFIRVIAMAYAIASIAVIPLCFIFVAFTIPAQLRGYRAATDPYEKTYWWLDLVGHALITYAAIITALLMIEGFCIDSWKISEWWPTLSGYWYGIDTYGNHNNMHNLILDMVTAFAAGFGATFVARYFGCANEDGSWDKSEWLVYKQHIMNEVIIENDMILDRDPSLNPNFEKLSRSTQKRKMKAWQAELDANEERLKSVQQTYCRSL